MGQLESGVATRRCEGCLSVLPMPPGKRGSIAHLVQGEPKMRRAPLQWKERAQNAAHRGSDPLGLSGVSASWEGTLRSTFSPRQHYSSVAKVKKGDLEPCWES